MNSATLADRDRRRRRRRRLLLLLLLAVSALPSVTTSYLAITEFTDAAVIAGDAWAAAPIDITVEPALQMEVSGMLPGDRHTGQLVVANPGGQDVRYVLLSTSTDPDGRGLRDALVTEIRAEGRGCPTFDGDLLYEGPMVDSGFGDPLAGPQAGDRILAPGERDLLCVRVTLPHDAGNGHQRSAAELTFTVIAERATVAP